MKVPDVWALCRFYRADDAMTDALSNLAIATAGEGWREEHNDVVPEWFKLRVGMESAASKIMTYEGNLVPGLLQTGEYARAIYRAAQPDADDDVIDRHVVVRLERQKTVFTRADRPEFVAILDEGVLSRHVGGIDVMTAQVAKLREVDGRGDARSGSSALPMAHTRP